MPEPTDSEDVEADDEAYGPMKKVPVPQTFQGWCSLISDIIAPAEVLACSPSACVMLCPSVSAYHAKC